MDVFCAVAIRGIQWKTLFTHEVPIALVEFSQYRNLTFKVESTAFSVLVIYLETSLILFWPLLYHVPVAREIAQRQPKTQLTRSRSRRLSASPSKNSLLIETIQLNGDIGNTPLLRDTGTLFMIFMINISKLAHVETGVLTFPFQRSSKKLEKQYGFLLYEVLALKKPVGQESYSARQQNMLDLNSL